MTPSRPEIPELPLEPNDVPLVPVLPAVPLVPDELPIIYPPGLAPSCKRTIPCPRSAEVSISAVNTPGLPTYCELDPELPRNICNSVIL
jgi:hypothetical protein